MLILSFRYKNCGKAIEWLCEAFGFKRHLVVFSSNLGNILHARLDYNGCMVMLDSVHGGDEYVRLYQSFLS